MSDKGAIKSINWSLALISVTDKHLGFSLYDKMSAVGGKKGPRSSKQKNWASMG